MPAAVVAGEEFTQAIIDHLASRANKECGRFEMKERHALRNEFRMKPEDVKRNIRSGLSVSFSFMDAK